MVLKPGPPPRSWLVSWTGFTDAVFVAFWNCSVEGLLSWLVNLAWLRVLVICLLSIG